mmetsp:Transcript_3982/g.11283  ORF Transcript_3982/g.11283 Transcript_3982/m.11283 type:complete len:132 (+) Transcript_3982:399-794(+)
MTVARRSRAGSANESRHRPGSVCASEKVSLLPVSASKTPRKGATRCELRWSDTPALRRRCVRGASARAAVQSISEESHLMVGYGELGCFLESSSSRQTQFAALDLSQRWRSISAASPRQRTRTCAVQSKQF